MKSTFAVPKTEESSMIGFANQIGMALDKFIWDRAAGTQRGLLGKMLQVPQRALLGRKWATNPVTMVKSATFDLMLGVFNPVQFFIQSSGMFIPFHLHPLTGTKIIPQFMTLRTLAGADASTVGGVARSMGMNGEEFQTLWHAWHRSGVPDSILENADFGHYLGTQGAYYSPDMLRAIRDRSRIFYNQGELNNRMYGFVMAFNRTAEKNGWDLTKRLTDVQIQEVNQEALRLGINFGAGNRARWQEGILSIPTQFWQVGHKYVENLMNGMMDNALGRKLGVRGKENSWTKQETMTALLGNMLLWGYASVGLDELFPSMEAWLTDPKGLGLDPEKDRILLAGMRGGFLEMMSLRALGVWPDVSDRTAPAAQMADIWKNTVTPLIDTVLGEGNAGDFIRAVGGASAGMGTRVGRAISDTLLTLDTSWKAGDIAAEDLETILSNVFGVASVFSNAQKFRVWREAGKRLDSQLRDSGIDSDQLPMDPRVPWLKLLGIDTIEVEMQRNLSNRQRDRKAEQKATQDALMVEFRKILAYDGTKGDSFVAAEANRRMKVIIQTLPREEQKYIWNKALSELDGPFAGNKFYEKLLEEFYNADPGSPLEQQLSQELRLYQSAQGISNAE
jgi:hypothetical protein